MANEQSRDIRHLGDFSATPRVLLIAALAVPVGAGSACVAWALLKLIGRITNAVFYQRASSVLVAPGGGSQPPWLILLAPVVGGLVVGMIARFGSEQVRGHGMPETIEAVLLRRSKVRPRLVVLKPVASSISIGTGGPFGAEGPIIITGGALGSLVAQCLHLTADERKTLLVAGSAAGVAAALNTPLAAGLLAVELLLFEWRPRSVIPVVTAVCAGTVVRIPLLGGGAMLPSSATFHVATSTYLFCAVSGAVAAVFAAVVFGLVRFSEAVFARLPLHWMWWPAIGGLIVGVGGLFVPEALGVGYNVLAGQVAGTISAGLVVGILVVKTLIWSLSLGSGTAGGILIPIFMIGGALGAFESHLLPAVGLGFWALIGMVGFATAMLRSPFAAILFGLELTNRWDLVLPLMIVAVCSFAVSVLTMRRSVPTQKIAESGHHVSREYDVDPLELILVSEVMTSCPLELSPHVTVRDALAALDGPADGRSFWGQALYPVVDAAGDLMGVVTRGELLTARRLDALDDTLTALVTTDPITTHGDQTLRYAAELMAVNGIAALPVVDRHSGTHAVGVLCLRQLLVGRERDHHESRVRERLIRFRRSRHFERPQEVNAERVPASTRNVPPHR